MGERNAGIRRSERIEFRIGINLGDVMVEDGDIFGDGVNIAARLEGLAEPGGICVSARFRRISGQARHRFRGSGRPELKNIARPVRVYRVASSSAVVRSRCCTAPPGAARQAVGCGVALPNMSGDPEQEFFADGIAEDIITALSRYPSLFVIARNSCFTYKGRAVDVKQVGRELGVRYVLEGSLRKSGNRIRVTAQLVEAETGKHVWAERYDRDLADIFAVQDEITEAVTIAIARQSPMPSGNAPCEAAREPRCLGRLSARAVAFEQSSPRTRQNSLCDKFFQQAISARPDFCRRLQRSRRVSLQAANTFLARDLPEMSASAEGHCPAGRRARCG